MAGRHKARYMTNVRWWCFTSYDSLRSVIQLDLYWMESRIGTSPVELSAIQACRNDLRTIIPRDTGGYDGSSVGYRV